MSKCPVCPECPGVSGAPRCPKCLESPKCQNVTSSGGTARWKHTTSKCLPGISRGLGQIPRDDLFPKTIIYDIGTKILHETCFATKMLLLFCKSMIPVRFCTILPLHSCAGIKTRFKALLKTQYLTLGPNL